MFSHPLTAVMLNACVKQTLLKISAIIHARAHHNIHDLAHVILHFVFSVSLIVVQSFVAPAIFCRQLEAIALQTQYFNIL